MGTSFRAITVAICTYNRYEDLANAIMSVAEQTVPRNLYDIIVIDNTPEHLRRLLPFGALANFRDVQYVIEATPGLANARNRCVAESNSPLIVFIDDDAIAKPSWLAEILRAFDEFGPSAAVVGGRVEPLWGQARPPWLHESLLGHLSVVDWGGKLRLAAATEWFAGTNIAFRREIIQAQGGFAVSLGRVGSGITLLSNEEIQLISKIRATGAHLVYAPDAVVEHLVDDRRLTHAWFRKRIAWQAVSDLIMDPVTHSSDLNFRWREVRSYFNSLPPYLRTVKGLYLDPADAGQFQWQLSAIYNNTILTLAGFDGGDHVEQRD